MERNRLEKFDVKLPERVISRKVLQKILPWMERDEIIVITGPRQVGKSVLLYQLINTYLLCKTEQIYYFNRRAGFCYRSATLSNSGRSQSHCPENPENEQRIPELSDDLSSSTGLLPESVTERCTRG